MLKFCPECGSKTNGGKFCSNCGADLTKFGASDSAAEDTSADSSLDDALENLMGFADEKQTESKLRTLIIREMYDEAKEICNSLIDNNPMDKVGYLGLIRIASKNYKEYEGADIAKQIRIAEEIFGADELSFDFEYTKYIAARKHYFEEKERKRKEAEEAEAERRRLEAERAEWERQRRVAEQIAAERAETERKRREAEEAERKRIENEKAEAERKRREQVAAWAAEVAERKRIEAEAERKRIENEKAKKAEEERLIKEQYKIGFAYRMIEGKMTRLVSLSECRNKNITKAIIPNNVTSIPNGAFKGCKSLKSVVIPDSIIIIESGAFEDCISLTSVSIPIGCRYEINSFPSRCQIMKR